MSGTGGTNLPVRITVEGQQQAEAAFNAVAAVGQRAMAQVAQGAGQATTPMATLAGQLPAVASQFQNVVTAVQGGGSAFGALATAASSVLSTLGPIGVALGTVVTAVGAYVVGMNDAKTRSDELAAAQQRLQGALQGSISLFETAAERARRLAGEQRATLALSFSAESRRVGDQIREAEADLEVMRRQQFTGRGTYDPAETRRQIQQAEADLEALRAQQREAERNRQTSLTAPTGADRDDAEGLRRSVNARYRIQAEYQDRVNRLRELDAAGTLRAGEIGRLEVEAAQTRDEALAALARRGGGGGREGTEGSSPDQVRASLDRLRDRARAQVQTDRDALRDVLGTANEQAGVFHKFEEAYDRLAAARRRDSISQEEMDQGVSAASQRLATEMDAIDRRANRASDASRELGMSFSSAFEDAIVKGKDLREVLNGIAQDLARIITRKAITDPLASAASGAMGAAGTAISNWWSGGSGTTISADANGFLFADGGIMTGRGPLPLRRYAGGGVARSPQLAMFGEGSDAEAYVPLPDGRSIPVTMNGGGGFTQHVTIDARGADAGVEQRIRVAMMAAKEQAKAELMAMISRGGSAARAVGRR